MLSRQLNRIRRRLVSKGWLGQRSYSQCGEDLIIDFLLQSHGIPEPSYLDIGAHHPTYLNNTKLFYLRGCKGVNVDANPHLLGKFQSNRPRDTNLHAGVWSTGGTTKKFFVLSNPTMSTFSSEEAQKAVQIHNMNIVEEINVPLLTAREIADKYFNGVFPEILSVDIEGVDFEVIKSLEDIPVQNLPAVLCVESLSYSADLSGQKRTDLITAATNLGFTVYADTYINTILINKARLPVKQL